MRKAQGETFGYVFNHKTPHTAAIEVVDIFVTVALACAQGKEKGGLREGQRPAVGQQSVNLRFGASETLGTDKCRYFFKRIKHGDLLIVVVVFICYTVVFKCDIVVSSRVILVAPQLWCNGNDGETNSFLTFGNGETGWKFGIRNWNWSNVKVPHLACKV